MNLARRAAALLLGSLVACSAVETESLERRGDAPSVQVLALWAEPERELLVGGLACALHQQDGDGTALVQGVTEPGRPLLFEALTPGRYHVTVQGQGREFTTPDFLVEAGHQVRVRIDLARAREELDRDRVLQQVGDGLFRLLAAPVTLTMRVFGSDLAPEDAFPLDEPPSGR